MEAVPLEKLAADGSESTVSGPASESVLLPQSPRTDSPPSSPGEMPDSPALDVVALADLPSIGSLGHFAGQCSRCCFHPKGRCLNGYDCRYCHFEHEKRQRKRKPVATSRTVRPWGSSWANPRHPAPLMHSLVLSPVLLLFLL